MICFCITDASFTDFMRAAHQCVLGRNDRLTLLHQIRELWLTRVNPNPVLTCLSVRTGLDLYLQVKNFPPGSEIIMSAINIPDMVHVVHHHKLKVSLFCLVKLLHNLQCTIKMHWLIQNLVDEPITCALFVEMRCSRIAKKRIASLGDTYLSTIVSPRPPANQKTTKYYFPTLLKMSSIATATVISIYKTRLQLETPLGSHS